jgi:DNA-binding transcriptional MerR regulator
MKDLCDAIGLPRQAIHFYIQQGLLPPGRKTGRNMAFYASEHLERLRLIKKLQHERFLPLKAIKALLDGGQEEFTTEQQEFLGNVRERIAMELRPAASPATTLGVDELCSRAGVDREDVERAVELDLVGSMRDEHDRLRIAEKDGWIFEQLAAMRAVGFTRELGFTIADVALYQDAMRTLFRREVGLVTSRLAGLPPEEAARMIERALPIIHTFLARYHADQVRELFAVMP